MTTILVTRSVTTEWRGSVQDGESELEVDISCNVYPAEERSLDCPGNSMWVEFESATVDGEDFELTTEEITEAEEAYMSDLIDARVGCD